MTKLPLHNFPKRRFCDGDKKMYSMRLPEKLMERLTAIAKDNGSTVTEISQTALDEWVQWYLKQK